MRMQKEHHVSMIIFEALVESQRLEKKGHRSFRESMGVTPERSWRSTRKSSHCIPAHRNPFHEGIHASFPMEISVFPDRAVFTILFAVRLLPVNSLTSHSLGAPVEFLLLVHAFWPPGSVSSLAVSFPPSRRSTHACWNVEALVRRLRHTRKYTRASRGCISMYFYARVIAPTVYFYPPSDM